MTVAQSRGNAMYSVNGEPMGTQRVEVALRFGPGLGRLIKQHINSKEGNGWDNDFHEYELEWTPGTYQMFGMWILFCWQSSVLK
jgi:hypothetical protein